MALSRNALNQRLSRARRKSYIASLIEKVQRYETQGVQATKEVQAAAQKVVDDNERLKVENERLRSLLADGSSSLLGAKCTRCGHDSTASGSPLARKQAPPRGTKRKVSDPDLGVTKSSKATQAGKIRRMLPESQELWTADDGHGAHVADPTPADLPSAPSHDTGQKPNKCRPSHPPPASPIRSSPIGATILSPPPSLASLSPQSPASNPSYTTASSTSTCSAASPTPCLVPKPPS